MGWLLEDEGGATSSLLSVFDVNSDNFILFPSPPLCPFFLLLLPDLQ